MKFGLTAAGIALLSITGLAFASFAGPSADFDSDGVYNVLDNCSTLANGGALGCDTDDDGYGNRCDGDFDQSSGLINSADFNKFLPDFKKGVDSGIGSDMDCSGGVNSADFNLFLPTFKAGKAGPSGLHCAGTVPCDL